MPYDPVQADGKGARLLLLHSTLTKKNNDCSLWHLINVATCNHWPGCQLCERCQIHCIPATHTKKGVVVLPTPLYTSRLTKSIIETGLQSRRLTASLFINQTSPKTNRESLSLLWLRKVDMFRQHGEVDGNMGACGMQGCCSEGLQGLQTKALFCSKSKGLANNEALAAQRVDLGIFTPALVCFFLLLSPLSWEVLKCCQ